MDFLKSNWMILFLAIVLVVAILFALNLFFLYSSTFGSAFPAQSRTDWGVMGDFFGGMLNPLFSILGLAMLLVTLFQNQRELELSRKELRESTKALAAQAATLEKQRFENTFFSLLDQLNGVLERMLTETTRYDGEGKPSKGWSPAESLKIELIGGDFYPLTERQESLEKAKAALLTHNPLINQYFRILYQILKLIAINSPDTSLQRGFTIDSLETTKASPAEKFYSNLVRSFIPDNVYYLLAINCVATNKTDQFYLYRLLVERYALLEHMRLKLHEHQNNELVARLVRHYGASAFGNNPDYISISR